VLPLGVFARLHAAFLERAVHRTTIRGKALASDPV
jgi:hypothetical protein